MSNLTNENFDALKQEITDLFSERIHLFNNKKLTEKTVNCVALMYYSLVEMKVLNDEIVEAIRHLSTVNKLQQRQIDILTERGK